MSEADSALTVEQRETLLSLARRSIQHGLRTAKPLTVDAGLFDPQIRAQGACFVTLTQTDRLRGCIGSLYARRPLCVDVAENAFAAAFRDPRFAPLQAQEFSGLHVEISVLTAPVALEVGSETELLQALKVGRDGLILEDGATRATFLPSVWEQIQDPESFVAALRRKAGLPVGHWDSDTRAYRYRTFAFAEAGDQ